MLVPSAPCLLPELTGGSALDLSAVRAAVSAALEDLVTASPDRVVVAARREPGTLAGFGVASGSGGQPGWAHEMGAVLLARSGWRGDVEAADTTTSTAGAVALARDLQRTAARTAVLVLADGSATRGPRAPGGEDARGDQLDAALGRDLRAGRVGAISDAEAVAVGCRGLPGLALFTSLLVTPAVSAAAEVRYEGAPTGVGYIVAVRPRHRP